MSALRTTLGAVGAPLLASLAAATGVLIVTGRWQPLVWQSFMVSLVYSVAISLVAQMVMPAVVRRFSAPGLPLTLAMSGALVGVAMLGSLLAGGALLVVARLTPDDWTPLTTSLGGGDFWATYAFMARVTAVLAIVSGLSTYYYERLTSALRETRARFEDQARRSERATTLAMEAKLSSLESRVQPHFLFNTLNSLSALISLEPRRAERMVEQLSALLRSSLTLPAHRLVTVEQEIAIVRDYLSLEQQRFGDRLRYQIVVDPEAATCLVPPFAVQSLVENALKHAIARSETGGAVDVTATRVAGGCVIDVSDSGPGFVLATIPAGHGLENVMARLDNAFGADARMDIGRRDGRCIVSLRIPHPDARASTS